MKKFLLSAILVASLGYFNQAKSQCAGAAVRVDQIVVTQSGTGGLTYNYSFRWTFIKGNASIQVVLKCGGVLAEESACLSDLQKVAGRVEGYFETVTGTITFDPACNTGAREFEIRIYSSSNCNGTFCIVDGSQITLPVSFASFNATRNRSNVSIAWSTASEQNNNGFAVERNTKGSWEQVAFVLTQAQGGNSDALLSYSYTDPNDIKGISQYRIRQVDIDAKSKFSEIRAVRGEGQTVKTTVYPNPSNNGKVNVVFDEVNVSRDVVLMDMSGRTVKQFKGITNNNITIDNLNPGMYSLRVIVPATGEQTMEKIIINQR